MNFKLPLVAATSILLSAGAFASEGTKSTLSNPEGNDEKIVSNAGIITMQGEDESFDAEGSSIVNDKGDDIGDIDRIVQSNEGKMAIIGLSSSMKEVAVPLEELRWQNDRFVINTPKSELESQSDIDMTDFEDLEPGQYSKADFAHSSEGAVAAYNSAESSAKTDNQMQAKSSTENDNNVDIEGVAVVNANGEDIGDVDRVVQSEDGKMAVIGLEGSMKEVAVSLQELSMENDRLVINTPKSELENKADVDMTDYEELEPGQYDRHEFARFETKMDEQQ